MLELKMGHLRVHRGCFTHLAKIAMCSIESMSQYLCT